MTDHEQAIRDACWVIALDWDASLHGKRQAGSAGTVSGTREAQLPVPAYTLDTRAQALARLAGWALVVLEERDLNTRFDTLYAPALARFLSRHAGWLAAHEAVEDVVWELQDSAGRIQRLAHPERREYVVIGECPVTVARDGESVPCGALVRAYTERNIIRCPGCGTEDTLAWWEARIVPSLEDKALLTASELAVFLHQKTSQVVTEEAIRQWAARGFILRHGRERNRTLYDRAAVLAWVTTRTRENAA